MIDLHVNEEEFVELIRLLQEAIMDDLKEGSEEGPFVAKCKLLSSMYDYMGKLLVSDNEK